LQARDAAGTRNGHRQRHLGVELPEPGGVLHVEPAADEAVVVVAPCVEQQVGERAGRGEGVEDVRRRVARMARAVGARMERAAGRHRAERVKELVRGDVRAGNPGARSEVDDGVRRARVRRAAALPTDVLLVRRPVVVHEVLRGIRVEGRPRELELQHSHPPLDRRERRGRGRELTTERSGCSPQANGKTSKRGVRVESCDRHQASICATSLSIRGAGSALRSGPSPGNA
jgi:hypothetical protein